MIDRRKKCIIDNRSQLSVCSDDILGLFQILPGTFLYRESVLLSTLKSNALSLILFESCLSQSQHIKRDFRK